jgi:hypothetical protein
MLSGNLPFRVIRLEVDRFRRVDFISARRQELRAHAKPEHLDLFTLNLVNQSEGLCCEAGKTLPMIVSDQLLGFGARPGVFNQGLV